MKNRKGFTLVELLAVVVIMGIVIGISIPAVTAVQKRMVKQRVNTFYRVVEESADAYVDQYHEDFDGLSNCFEIPYDNLIKEDLLKETDITCLSEAFGEVQGKVIATKVNDGGTYQYSFYLTCYDKETNKLLAKSDRIPEGCLGVNGGYSIDVNPVHVQDNSSYNGTWVSGSVRYDIEGYSPYFYPISSFQYKKEFAIEWHSENTTITDSNGKGYILFSTSNNANPEESSINTRVKFRGVDTGNNISTDNGWYDLKIDNTVPTASIAYSGTGWENSDVILTFVTNSVPSGIKAFYIDLDNNGTVDATVASGVTYTLDSNFNGTIKVKAESNTGIMGSWSNPKTIQIDKTPPTCTVTTSNANWTKDNVTITGTCHDEGGSGCATNATRVFSTNTNSNESPGQVCDGAGNCTTCGTTTVKVDKSEPVTSDITITNRTQSANPVVSATCSDSFGELNSTSATVSCVKTDNNSTCTATCSDKAGNSSTKTSSYTWSAASNPCGWNSCTTYYDCMNCSCGNNCACGTNNCRTCSAYYDGRRAVTSDGLCSVPHYTTPCGGSCCGDGTCKTWTYYDCRNCSCGNTCSCGAASCSTTNNQCSAKTCWH